MQVNKKRVDEFNTDIRGYKTLKMWEICIGPASYGIVGDGLAFELAVGLILRKKDPYLHDGPSWRAGIILSRGDETQERDGGYREESGRAIIYASKSQTVM